MEDKLREDLRQLGLDEESYRVLVLLPLIQVAWADGRMQSAEVQEIERVAAEFHTADNVNARAVLQRWLRTPPSDAELRMGMELLIELARRQGNLGGDLTALTLQDLLELCHRVARAAGDLFGLTDPVSREERDVLEQLADRLSIDTGQSWVEIYQRFEGS